MPELLLPSFSDPIEYVIVGEGPPVVFLHGAPGDLRTWIPVTAQLADRYRCISYTQRWFGDRTWTSPGSAFGTESHAADLCDLVAALGLAPASLVAWSYSGHVALLAALRRPDLFDRMLVYEPSVGTYVADPAARSQMDADAARMFPPLAEALAQGDAQAVVRRLIDASGGPGWFDRQPAERRAIHLASAPMMPLLMGGGAPPADLRAEDLAGLQIPITIAWGAETRDLFRLPSKAAAARLSLGDHFEVPGAGHLLPEADPVRFAKLVADWMARRPGVKPP
jgi:pimeloyl-ACP methyl ester carboxylesterase